MRLLSDSELAPQTAELAHWQIDGGKLCRKIVFEDFIEAFSFISKVALVSHSMNHHPEWRNVFNEVEIMLVSHDVQGISDLDIRLATEIDELLARSSGGSPSKANAGVRSGTT